MAKSGTTGSDAGTCGCEDLCSLPGDELQDRVAMIRREILPLAKRRETLADGLAFEFDHTAAIQRTLEDFVAFERECCSGLTWDVSRTSQRLLRLSIRGLPPDSDFFRVGEDAGEDRLLNG